MNKWPIFLFLIFRLNISVANELFEENEKGVFAPLNFQNLSLEKILSSWATISGRVIIWEKGERGLNQKVVFQSFTQMKTQEIDNKLISLLGDSGLFPVMVDDAWVVTPLRDIRYLPVPEFEQGKTVALGQMRRAYISFKYPIGELVARSFRPFSSRYGRIVTFPGNKGLIVMDFAESIEKMMVVAQTLDSKENYQQWIIHKREQFFTHKQEELAKSHLPVVAESESNSGSNSSKGDSSEKNEKINLPNIKQLKIAGDDVLLLQKEVLVTNLFQNYFEQKGIGYLLKENKRDDYYIWNGPLKIGQVPFFSLLGRLAERQNMTITLNEQDNVYGLEQGRDLRYKMQHSYEKLEELPKENRITNFIYRPSHVKAKELASLARPLTTRYGRISTIDGVPFVMIQDYSDQIREIVSLFQKIDNSEVNESSIQEEKMIRQWEEEFQSPQSKSSFISSMGTPQELIILLGIIIFLVGGIIGFGMRAYVIRKWEGGL